MQKMSRFSPVPVRTGIFPQRSMKQTLGGDARPLAKITKLFTTLSVTFILVCAVLFLQRTEHPAIEPVVTTVRLWMANALAPVIRLTEAPLQMVSSAMEMVTSNQTLQDENVALQLKNQYLQRQQAQFQQLMAENQQLRKALSLQAAQEQFHSAARVTGHSYNGASSHLIVSSQASEKIKKNNPVLSVEGYLVGRVVSTSVSDARVMPLVNINSHIPVQMEETREHAILKGDQSLGLRLTHLEKASPVKVGTKLVTSGVGGVFPAGIPVAVVTEVEGDQIKATPYIEMKKLDYVVVLQ